MSTTILERETIISSRLHCQVISDADKLYEYVPAWNDLLSRSAHNEHTLSPLWMMNWWDIYGKADGWKLRVGLFFDDARLVGVAPLCWGWFWHRGIIPLRQIRPLAGDQDWLDTVYSNYLGLIIEQGQEKEVARSFVQACQKGLFGTWDEMFFPMMAADQEQPQLLSEQFSKCGYLTELKDAAQSGYTELPTTWENYLASLKSKNRKYVKKTLKDFDEWAAGTTQYFRASAREELDQVNAILHQLHAERWQAAGQSGVFAAPRYRAFHDRVMQELFRNQHLELCWLAAHGKPVAAVYNIVWDGKVNCYQSGRAMNTPGHIRPTLVLHLMCLRNAIERGCREFDTLANIAQWKKQISLSVRQMVDLRITRGGVKEWLRWSCERTLDFLRPVRRWLKRK